MNLKEQRFMLSLWKVIINENLHIQIKMQITQQSDQAAGK